MSQRDRAELERWVLSPSMPAGLVMRVRVVLAAADGAGTGALVCGWPTGRVSADSSSKRMTSQRRLRMPPRRHKTEWPYVDLHPLGAPRQSRTTVDRLLARLIRRLGAEEPDHEYVANTAVDRHHRGRRYAPAGLIEYLNAGGPVVPVAPARHRATPAPPPARTRPGQQARARGV